MGKLNVKNGTPMGAAHLCRSCSWGQCITGYRESDFMVICTNANPNFRVPFVVMDCSEFSDRNRPSWQQMEKLAVEIKPGSIATRVAGFSGGSRVQPIRRVAEAEEPEQEDPETDNQEKELEEEFVALFC